MASREQLPFADPPDWDTRADLAELVRELQRLRMLITVGGAVLIVMLLVGVFEEFHIASMVSNLTGHL